MVDYMQWATFVEGVDNVKENVLPNTFTGYDLIWGGADLNLDIR